MIVARYTCETRTPEGRNGPVLPEFHKGGSSNRSVMMKCCNRSIEADAHAGLTQAQPCNTDRLRRAKFFASLRNGGFAERVVRATLQSRTRNIVFEAPMRNCHA